MNLLVIGGSYFYGRVFVMEAVKEQYKDYLYIVLSCENKDVIPFYQKLGFSVIEGSTPMQINRL